jgi:uncharacterized membrane protein
MDIRNLSNLKATARRRLADAPQEKRIVLIYSLLVMGLALLATAVRYVLGMQIDQMGGLSNMSTRTILSTVQSVLPLVQSLVVMCLDLGYLSAMLRIARGQYASPNGLRLGFDRFWVLLRCSLIRGLYYACLTVSSVYLASVLFVMSPWGDAFNEAAAPLLSQTSLLSPQIALDDTVAMALLPTMVPMFVILAITLGVLVLPVVYRFRMASYVIIDKPGMGALAALRESRKMMRGNCLKLLKLDLSYWWYFLVLLVIASVGNLDLWLPLFGIRLPMNSDVAYFLFYGLYLVLQIGAYCLLRNRIEVTYGLVYNALKPEEPKDNGVVLGNIFQM